MESNMPERKSLLSNKELMKGAISESSGVLLPSDVPKFPSRLQAAVLPIIDCHECVKSSPIYSLMSNSSFCAGYLQSLY
ncbi:hypothetical protein DICVIV_08168 [Dictyocaulus viviparus]|uniref:Uncharacterized protein n=1 Tax=Dictyocaulus viviparus TaxID=29172 RepID=A0A0D8XPW1_DICVI|nr:hypothetical protein DICVIV_08168 [Dictyocaulus viviparus]